MISMISMTCIYCDVFGAPDEIAIHLMDIHKFPLDRAEAWLRETIERAA